MGHAYEDFLNKTIAEQDAEITSMKKELDLLREIVSLSSRTCGRHNCNCPGSKQIKDLVDAYFQRSGKTNPSPAAR